MCQSSHDDRVALLDDRIGNSLEASSGPRDDASLVHVQEFCELAVEVLDTGFRDLVEPEWLSAEVAGRVAIAVGDDRFPGLRCETACRLDGWILMYSSSLVLTSSLPIFPFWTVPPLSASTSLSLDVLLSGSSLPLSACSCSAVRPLGSDCLNISLTSSSENSASNVF